MRKLLHLFFLVMTLPAYAGVEVEYAVILPEGTPEAAWQFLPQRILIGLHDEGIVVRGEYMGAYLGDYDLHPRGHRFAYRIESDYYAVQMPFSRAVHIEYTDDAPVLIAGLPSFRAIARQDGEENEIFFTTAFGVDFCQVADIRGFALQYSRTINGLKVIYQAVKYRPAQLPAEWFDLSRFLLAPYRPLADEPSREKDNARIGEPAPALAGRTLDGKRVSLDSLKGKVVVMHFWFTDCLPCKQEIPQLNQLAARYRNRDDVVFLSVSLDGRPSTQRFLRQMPFLYEVLYSGYRIAERYKIESYPTNLVINQRGFIARFITGFAPDTRQLLDQAITRALEDVW